MDADFSTHYIFFKNKNKKKQQHGFNEKVLLRAVNVIMFLFDKF